MYNIKKWFRLSKEESKATADVKADMESNRPMDRLVCGDVGFGKTEKSKHETEQGGMHRRHHPAVSPAGRVGDTVE